MSNASIKIEFLAGTNIKNAIIKANLKATKFDFAYVEFNFNSILISVRAGFINIKKGVEDYHKILVSTGKNKYLIIV